MPQRVNPKPTAPALVVDAETLVAPEAPKPKKAPRDKSKPSKKRGPARPYRRLAIDILDKRIAKLTKRITKAKTQLEESEGFLTKYSNEKKYRQDEPDEPTEDAATKIEATLADAPATAA
jgi:hypothetical protein